MSDVDKVVVENVNHPGKTQRVDRAKYEAMRAAMLAALPSHAPGLTQSEMVTTVKVELPEALFPGGATAGWWAKAVQLDLEAKGVITREGRPLRWRLAG